MARLEALQISGLFTLLSVACSPGAAIGSDEAAGSAGSAPARGGTSAAGAPGSAGDVSGAGAGGGHADNSGGHANAGADGSSAGSAGSAGAITTRPALVTSEEGAYWKTDGQLTEVTSGSADVTVDDSAQAQLWQGFGGTFSERSGDYLSLLSTGDRERALNLLFGVDGLRFNYGRVPIGASDYAIDRYSLDETPGDTQMLQFSIERDKEKLIPYIKAALAVAPGLHLWASPWSPPTWMKSNAAFDSGHMNEDDATLQAYALYLSRFVQEYGKLGIPIEVVHPQKEPNLELDFPSCAWSALGMTKFIGAHLGPTFADQQIGSQIFLGSLSEDGGTGLSAALIDAVAADSTAMSYVRGYGFEWDGLDLVAVVKAKALPIWQDNHNVGNLPWLMPFNAIAAPNDHAYAVTSWGFIRDWIRAGVSAYLTSNMVLDSGGVGIGTKAWPENALLVVDTVSKRLLVTPAFYVFRHLAWFVDPGAQVVGTSGGDALAFKNPDGSLVTVVYNAGTANQTTVAVAGKKLQFDMPANGWATVYVK